MRTDRVTGTGARAARAPIAAAIAVAAASGLILALWTPRGALTAPEALMTMALGALTGLAAGYLMRSRWAMLVAPPAHVAAFELGRIAVDGPLVDTPQLGTSYGILALILGRGVQALLVLAPMLLGAVYAAALTRRSGSSGDRGRPVGLWIRRSLTGLATAGLLGLAVWVVWPADVPPVRDAGGGAVPGSVATLEPIRINGHTNWVSIRGHSRDLPVLLFLSGGPGQTDMPQTRVLFRDLEDDFLVVNWDERGVGKAYPELDPVSTLSLNSVVDDTLALAEHLRRRFDERKIYLVGESWGSLLGVLAVERRPDLFHAYVGSGQMVDLLDTDGRLYEDMLRHADETGAADVAATIRDFGPPPYDSPFANAYVMSHYEQLAGGYDVPRYVEERYEEDPYGPWGVLGDEYTLMDKVNVMRGLIDYFSVLYPQLQATDLRRDARRLEVPVFVIQGRHELQARTALVPGWLAGLRAPRKELMWFEDAGHATAFEDFRRFERVMTERVVPAPG